MRGLGTARPLAWAILTVAAGCHGGHRAPAPEPAGSVAVAVASATPGDARPTAAAAPSSPGSDAGPDAADAAAACTDAAYRAAIARGRTLMRDRRYAEAQRAYEDAVHARPFDAQARAELGFAMLLAGEPQHAVDELRIARSRHGSDPLGSQIWFNLGLAYEATRDAEGARAAFAWALKLAPSKAASAKLAGASTCVGALRVPPALDVRSASAAAELCRGPDGHDACTGRAPWTVHLGSQNYHLLDDVLFRLADGTVAVVEVATPGGNCRGGWTDDVALRGDFVVVVHAEQSIYPVVDEPCTPAEVQPDTDGSLNECSAELLHAIRIYDARTGKPLAAVESAGAELTASVESGVLHVTGEGCDDRISLDGPARRLP